MATNKQHKDTFSLERYKVSGKGVAGLRWVWSAPLWSHLHLDSARGGTGDHRVPVQGWAPSNGVAPSKSSPAGGSNVTYKCRWHWLIPPKERAESRRERPIRGLEHKEFNKQRFLFSCRTLWLLCFRTWGRVLAFALLPKLGCRAPPSLPVRLVGLGLCRKPRARGSLRSPGFYIPRILGFSAICHQSQRPPDPSAWEIVCMSYLCFPGDAFVLAGVSSVCFR